jgi:hypothetical protein
VFVLGYIVDSSMYRCIDLTSHAGITYAKEGTVENTGFCTATLTDGKLTGLDRLSARSSHGTVTIADGSGTVNGGYSGGVADGSYPVADDAYFYPLVDGSIGEAVGPLMADTYSDASVLLNGSGEIMAIVHGPVD